MKFLTHNNHFKFGYDNLTFLDNTKQWGVTYGSYNKPPKSFNDECINTVKLIHEKYCLGRTIYLGLSGGIDSEIIALSLLAAKIPFICAIMRYGDNLNAHDIEYAIKFCENKKITYEFFDLNIEEFYSIQAIKFACLSKSSTASLLTQMWLLDEIHKRGSYPILGSAECYLFKNIKPEYTPGISEYGDEEWYMWEREVMSSLYTYLINTQRDGCPGFFQFTPELMASFLTDDIVIKLINNEIPGKLSSVSSKYTIYKKYFDIEPRIKYTGYENLYKDYYDLMFNSVKDYPLTRHVVNIKYTDVINHLNPKM